MPAQLFDAIAQHMNDAAVESMSAPGIITVNPHVLIVGRGAQRASCRPKGRDYLQSTYIDAVTFHKESIEVLHTRPGSTSCWYQSLLKGSSVLANDAGGGGADVEPDIDFGGCLQANCIGFLEEANWKVFKPLKEPYSSLHTLIKQSVILTQGF